MMMAWIDKRSMLVYLRRVAKCLLLGMSLCFATASSSASAATLRVSPTFIHVPRGDQTAKLRLWNDNKTPVGVQVRVFRVVPEGKKSALQPTHDVVVSPPMAMLKPGTENLIRIVRVAKTPVTKREDYRLVVDQLPDGSPVKSGTVRILIRQVLPLDFE